MSRRADENRRFDPKKQRTDPTGESGTRGRKLIGTRPGAFRETEEEQNRGKTAVRLDKTAEVCYNIGGNAGVAELADALDLGSNTPGVQVQVLSPVPKHRQALALPVFWYRRLVTQNRTEWRGAPFSDATRRSDFRFPPMRRRARFKSCRPYQKQPAAQPWAVLGTDDWLRRIAPNGAERHSATQRGGRISASLRCVAVLGSSPVARTIQDSSFVLRYK